MFGPRPWAQLSALLALVTSPSSAWAAPTYDPSGAVLVGQAGRQWSADLAASQLSAWIGGGVIVALGALVVFGAVRLLRDLQPRAQLAIALGVGLLTARLMVSAFLSPIRDGDELIDFAQVALAPFIGLKPVELIFPTGWTLLSGAVHALWLQIHVSGETALDLANATLDSLRGGFVLTRWISSLSCGLLALAMARRATLAGGVSGGLLAAGIWLTSLPTTYLATAAGPHAMATSLTWLGVLLATAGQAGVTRALMVGLLWGAAVGTQPLAVVVIASCGAWLGLSWLKAGRWRALAALCGAGAVGWVLTNPWVWQQLPVYVENFRYRFAELGAQEAVADHSSGQYTRWLWRHPVVVGGLSAWGVFTLASGRLRERRLLVAPVVGLVTAAVLASLSTRFDRYLIWALPVLAAGRASRSL